MAKWKRISGEVTVTISFNDRKNEYQATVCAPREGCERVNVGVPRALRRAVDSPASITDAARAAINFAREDYAERAEWNGRGIVMHKPRTAASAARRSRVNARARARR